jgi:transcriptional regulator with XRE-family HTH domain
MAQVGQLVSELKRHLKARGITYAQLAKRLRLSESSVKRLFARETFSLKRFEQICNAIGLEIADLVDLMNERREYLTELSDEQEAALLSDAKLLLLTYLLINGWTTHEIVAAYELDDRELERLLIRLHRAKIIELQPLNRVKLLTARNFRWRPDGALHRFFKQQVQREFLDSAFANRGERFALVGGLLSQTSLAQLQHSIDRVAREFDELARRDAALPFAERSSSVAVLALRPWEFSMFVGLRRKATDAAQARASRPHGTGAERRGDAPRRGG